LEERKQRKTPPPTQIKENIRARSPRKRKDDVALTVSTESLLPRKIPKASKGEKFMDFMVLLNEMNNRRYKGEGHIIARRYVPSLICAYVCIEQVIYCDATRELTSPTGIDRCSL